MPFAIFGFALVAFMVLSVLGVGFLAATLIGAGIYFLMLLGHGLIQGMGKVADEGGWITSGVFYVLLYVPLLLLNWGGSIVMIAWTSDHKDFLGPYLSVFNASPSTIGSWNRAANAVIGWFSHMAYGFWGAVTWPPSPKAYVTMLFAGQLEVLVAIGFVWLVVALIFGSAMVRHQKAREAVSILPEGSETP